MSRSRRGFLLAAFLLAAFLGSSRWWLDESVRPAARPAQVSTAPREAPGTAPDPPARAEQAPHEPADTSSQPLAAGEAGEVPGWLLAAIEPDGALGPAQTNHASQIAPASLEARHLRVLQDIIDENRLAESAATGDHDDGDGVFEPWELGLQVWQGGRLLALALGPDPYGSFGYRITRLPKSIRDLDTLQYLDLQGNALTSLPESLGALTALRELRLHRNQLDTLPSGFAGLTGLRRLALGGNQLYVLPDAIGSLPQLEWLQLDGNPLLALPETLSRALSLRKLGVSAGPSQAGLAGGGLDELPSGLASLPNLEVLYVSGNRLACGGRPAVEPAREGLRIYGLSAQRCAGAP